MQLKIHQYCCDSDEAKYRNIDSKAGGTKILLVRPAYSYNIVLIVIIVFVLKALINLYVRSEY